MKQFPRGEMKTRRNHGGCNFLRVVYTFARLAKKKKKSEIQLSNDAQHHSAKCNNTFSPCTL